MPELAQASEVLDYSGGLRAIGRKKRNAVWKGAVNKQRESGQFVHFPKRELLINIAWAINAYIVYEPLVL